MDSQRLFDYGAGTLDRRAYSDAGLYEQELERIFARCWQLLTHESLVPDPGSYVVSYLGEDPVLVWRGADGQLAAFLNVCPSGTAAIAPAEAGQAESLLCHCHGWRYASDGHANHNPALALLPLPCVAAYKGLDFGSFDALAPSRSEYLGDFAWYLDMLLDRREGGTELIGGIAKRIVATNWKLPVEAFIGDVYRERVSHASLQTMPDRRESDLGYESRGYQISAGMGGLAALWRPERQLQERSPLREYEEESTEHVESHLGTIRARALLPITGALFPNLAIHWDTATLHVWHPRGPSYAEVWTYCLVDRAAPRAVKDAFRRRAGLYHGLAGVADQEDAASWASITRSAHVHAGQAHPLNLQMGLGKDGYHEDLPGRVSPIFTEMNQRHFYRRWQEMLRTEKWTEIGLDPTSR